MGVHCQAERKVYTTTVMPAPPVWPWRSKQLYSQYSSRLPRAARRSLMPSFSQINRPAAKCGLGWAALTGAHKPTVLGGKDYRRSAALATPESS